MYVRDGKKSTITHLQVRKW